MTTVNDVVVETRRLLHGGQQDLLNALDTSLSAAATSVNMADSIKGVGRGSILEVGSETMYVRSANEGSKTATVFRGHDGTEAAAHNTGETIRINPSYSTAEIFGAVKDEIRSLKGSGLYWFDTQTISYGYTQKVYDLTLDVSNRTPLFVAETKFERDDGYKVWSPAVRVELMDGMDPNDFSSTYGLRVIDFPKNQRLYHTSSTNDIRVTVAFTLGVPTALTDTLSEADNGIGDHIIPIIAPGAAWRMVLGKEGRRVNPDRSHGSRRAEEVQPGSSAFYGRALLSMRDENLRMALQAQIQRHPYRMDV